MEKGAHGPEPVIVPFSDEATFHFNNWLDEKATREGRGAIRLQSVFGKSDGLVGRIALWLWALEWAVDDELDLPKEIGVEYVKRAIFFRETYIKPMQIRVWQHAGETVERKHARGLAEWIAENRPKKVNLPELRRDAGIDGLKKHDRAENMEEAANFLIKLQWLYPIEEDKRGTRGGAPRKDFGVNDRLYELLDGG